MARDCLYGEVKIKKGSRELSIARTSKGKSFDVHPCGHMMRILQGLNKKTKCIFYVPEMYTEINEKWYKNGVFGHNVQTWWGKKGIMGAFGQNV